MLAETSRAAHAVARDSGAAANDVERVLRFVVDQDRAIGYTRAEIAKATSIPLQTVCARVRDILDEDEPQLAEIAARDCRVTGNPSKPLRPKTATPLAVDSAGPSPITIEDPGPARAAGPRALKHAWDELQVGDRFIDQGEVVEVTAAPKIVHAHGKSAKGERIEFDYTAMRVKVVGRAR